MGTTMTIEAPRSTERKEDYIQIHGELFEAVQKDRVFSDSKTFVDCVPTDDSDRVLNKFLACRTEDDFDLEMFVRDQFTIPEEAGPVVNFTGNRLMEDHIQALWTHLIKPPHEDTNDRSTLIPLPYPYVVPGGRFREIYYWDSYFVSAGLAACGDMDTVEDMVRNLAHLIEEFGFVPNGNRIYYLSRSQPPVFASILSILERERGRDSVTPYLSHLELEYRFWMDGKDTVDDNVPSNRRVVQPDDTVMNRYWDDRAEPRPEAYREDVTIAQNAPNEAEYYRHVRAACESGWDFSSRWLGEDNTMETIRTTDIMPVDLNAMLYFMEQKLGDWFAHAGDDERAQQYREAAERRKSVFNKYFWDDDDGFYFDYNWRNDRQTDVWSLAAVAPLFYGISSQEQADAVATHLKERFLEDGGLVTTLEETPEQWDRPNGWAPLHWLAINGLLRYDHNDLAADIAHRWIQINRDVYRRTGKMMEKYNVCDTSLRAGGGEYKLQDGFGWTNGVAIALLKNKFPVETTDQIVTADTKQA